MNVLVFHDLRFNARFQNFQNYSCFSNIFLPNSVQQTISGVHQKAFHICCLIIHPYLKFIVLAVTCINQSTKHIAFHDFPDLENEIIDKFHDFPGFP